MSTPAWCRWCNSEVSEDERTLAGVDEVSSGPGRPLYACGPCMVAYRIVPLADHPADTDGRPQYKERRIAL